MTITYARSLTESQVLQIQELTKACQLHDHISLSFPIEDPVNCWLIYHEDELLAVLSLLQTEDSLWECRAFTHPSLRRGGLFSRLLSQASEWLDQYDEKHQLESELCFPVDPSCTQTMDVLEHLKAEHWYSEYMMVRLLNDCISASEIPSVRLKFRHSETDGSWSCSSWMEETLIGTCSLLPHGSSLYLYEVLVPEALRGRGLGTALMNSLLALLAKRSVPSILLQVSGDNTAAVALYKKTGFQITETLSYYLY